MGEQQQSQPVGRAGERRGGDGVHAPLRVGSLDGCMRPRARMRERDGMGEME
jgi:hypothetical protein